MKSEYYQSGLAVECLRALANLAKVTGNQQINAELSEAFDRQWPALDKAFWPS